jgi:gamma-glutamyltranspeptidase / glutathione hydrolase
MLKALIFLFLVGCAHKVNIVTPSAPFSRNQYEAESKNHMVTSQGEATTKATIEILKSGGNIIDAFVTASFMISVERPQSTGIGGGGFLLFYKKSENKVYAFDFREMAPVLAKQNMFLSKDGSPQPLLSQVGPLAIATPGLVAGLYEIHKKWGKLAWSELLAPAINLARVGFPNYPHLHLAINDRKHVLASDPDAKRIFLKDGDAPLSLGELVIQQDLARTLELIAEQGRDGFYKGQVAKSIIKTVRSKRGILTEKDLRDYKVKERVPVSSIYKGLKIFSMPPPSSGGIHVIQILKMLENYNLKKMGPQSVGAVHLTAQSMQRAFLDRATYLGDPDFSEVPVGKLLDPVYLDKLSKQINTEKAIKAVDLNLVPLPKESTETTHFSIADSEGNLVASTQTINGWFGSGVIAKGTGVILNNEMDDFAQKVGALNLFSAVGGEKNLITPKKRPLSSMSPTIILKNDNPYMALGSPSGTRIITCVAQTILNSVEFEMPLFESVAATRIHQQWQPDKLKIESPFLSPKVESELKLKGHDIVHEKLGCSIQAIQKTKTGWTGVSDPRGEGLALGN